MVSWLASYLILYIVLSSDCISGLCILVDAISLNKSFICLKEIYCIQVLEKYGNHVLYRQVEVNLSYQIVNVYTVAKQKGVRNVEGY